MTKTTPILSFAKLEAGMPMPHLLDIQTQAFQALLQPGGREAERTDVGLERVFKEIFPITDVNGNYSLEFVKYALGEPKYTVEECIERDMTYSAPLRSWSSHDPTIPSMSSRDYRTSSVEQPLSRRPERLRSSGPRMRVKGGGSPVEV